MPAFYSATIAPTAFRALGLGKAATRKNRYAGDGIRVGGLLGRHAKPRDRNDPPPNCLRILPPSLLCPKSWSGNRERLCAGLQTTSITSHGTKKTIKTSTFINTAYMCIYMYSLNWRGIAWTADANGLQKSFVKDADRMLHTIYLKNVDKSESSNHKTINGSKWQPSYSIVLCVWRSVPRIIAPSVG